MTAGTYRAALDAVMTTVRRRVYVDPATGCHLWVGATGGGNRANGCGGRPQIRWQGRLVYVARLVLAYRLGRPLRENMLACHSCVNVDYRCVNPDHLDEGDYRENMRAHWVQRRKRLRPRTLVG